MAEITVINEINLDWLLLVQYETLKLMWHDGQVDAEDIVIFMQWHNPVNCGDWLSDSWPCWRTLKYVHISLEIN